MALPPQPLELTDFSGGITENTLQGDPRRAAKLDNWIITNDKKLVVRNPFILHSSTTATLPGATGQRINGMFTFVNESILMALTGRKVYYIAPGASVWSSIAGVNSAPVIQGGDERSQVTYAEFQRQVYLTSDGTLGDNGVQPSKIYRDSTNVWVAKTAGMPRATVQGSYSDTLLLQNCIALANDLRTQFIAHMGEAANSTYSAQTFNYPDAALTSNAIHLNADKYSLQYLTAQTFISGDPETNTATPVAAATNQATLFTLVAALNNAYTHHMQDARKSIGAGSGTGFGPNPYYHWSFNQVVSGPHADLEFNSTPTTVAGAATLLDDLVQKYNWHRKAVFLHNVFNDQSFFDKYAPTKAKIGDYAIGTTAPTITPDFTDIYNYVNNLRYIYNSHVTNAVITGQMGGHTQRDNFAFGGTPNSASYQFGFSYPGFECKLAECANLDDMYLLIFWLRNLYYLHNMDAYQASVPITFTTTANSTAITAVIRTDTGAAYTAVVGNYLYCPTGTAASNNFKAVLNQFDSSPAYSLCQVTAAGSGTITADRQAVSTTTVNYGQVSYSKYHLNHAGAVPPAVVTGTRDFSAGIPTLTNTIATPLNSIGTSTSGWLDLALELFGALSGHMQRIDIHDNQATYRITSTLYYNLLGGVPYPNFFIPSVASYAYAFYFSDPYTVEPNGLSYLTRGNPYFTRSLDCAISYPIGYQITGQNLYTLNDSQKYKILNTRTNVISNLPRLVNTADTNYDLSNVLLNIYRSTDGGNTFYKIDAIANGSATTYTDFVNDTVDYSPTVTRLNTRESMYTTGGVVGNDPPPTCKFTHAFGGFTYYGAITDTGQFFPSRIRQSKENEPDSAPATFYKDLEDELVAISSTRANLLGLCRNSVYRIAGGFSTTGQGSITADGIADAMGCLNAKSVIKTEIGVFYAGTDGFYYTDGYQIIKLSLELDKTYAKLVQSDSQKRAIYGAYDKLTRKIWWSMQASSSEADNSIIYVYYLDFGVKPSATFSTVSNGLNLKPSSLVFQKGTLYVGHGDGYVLKDYADGKDDAKVDTTVSTSLWNTLPIPYDYTSLAIDLGTTFKRKWITKIHIVGKNSGNMSMLPYALKDLNQTGAGQKAMSPINYTANCTWGDPNFVWGASSFIWKYDGKMDLWRRFPASTLRSDFMQVRLVPNPSAVVYASSLYPAGCNAQVDGTAKTATIITPSGYTSITWPLDVVGYSISFGVDFSTALQAPYGLTYAITALDVTQKILTLSDPSGTLITAAGLGLGWQITGTKKAQRPTITSLTLHYAYLGDNNENYPGAFTNSGSGNAGGNP